MRAGLSYSRKHFGSPLLLYHQTRRSSTLPKTIRQLLEEGPTLVTHESKSPETSIHGWIKSVRRQKHIAFAQLSDGTEQNSRGLQIVFENPGLADTLSTGSSVKVRGSLVKSPAKGQDYEFSGREVTLLGACDPDAYPIQKKSHTVEFLRDHAHLRSRTDEIAQMLRLRHAAKKAFEDYYDRNDFISVHAPIVTTNDCEGGGEVFLVTPDQSPVEAAESTSKPDFFGAPAYLTVSSQLHLEVFASALSRVYTLQPAFRAERSHTSRHLSEFWMLEAEMSFIKDLESVMGVVEASLKHVFNHDDFRNAITSSERIAYLDQIAAVPWTRITYTHAIDRIKGSLGSDAIQWGEGIPTELERWIVDEIGEGVPIFVTDYPTILKPFYMRPNNEDGIRDTVACFDLLVPRIGELAGGSLREERYDRIKDALQKHNLEPERYGWYTELRRFGTTPHGGFGLGFERFISWIGGWENIRECIPAPRWKGRCIL